jgi:hypothetical protein
MTSAVKQYADVGVDATIRVYRSSMMIARALGRDGPVTATVDHADIRGLVTTLLVVRRGACFALESRGVAA